MIQCLIFFGLPEISHNHRSMWEIVKEFKKQLNLKRVNSKEQTFEGLREYPISPYDGGLPDAMWWFAWPSSVDQPLGFEVPDHTDA
eukprot:5862886-Karenia_brevis.AAC.1